MRSSGQEPFGRPRWMAAINPAAVILVCVLSLSILGFTVLFSASVSLKADPFFYLSKQLVWFVLAGVACLAVSRMDLEDARRYVWVFAAVCLVGLLLVLIPGIGIAVKGSRRWLGFGPVRLQISEFAKLAMVFGLAHYLALNQTRISELVRGFFAPLAWITGFAGLILLEPDFGTAALTFAIGVILLFLAGGRLRYLITAFAGAAALLAVAVIHNPNRLARFLAFLDVEGNRSGGTYQLWQAILAFAAGGVEGVGLGQGRQQNSFLAGGAHRFHLRGHRRGTGAGLHDRRGGPVRDPVCRGIVPPAQGPQPVSVPPRGRLPAAHQPAGDDQSRRGDRMPADQGHVAAFHQRRRIEPPADGHSRGDLPQHAAFMGEPRADASRAHSEGGHGMNREHAAEMSPGFPGGATAPSRAIAGFAGAPRRCAAGGAMVFPRWGAFGPAGRTGGGG